MSASSSTTSTSSAIRLPPSCLLILVVLSPSVAERRELGGVEGDAHVRPAAGRSRKAISPICSSTIFLTIARPSPVPLTRVVI